ncbi:MAG: OmpH family outer membrane protein [Bacteroides sp.]|nr:OmpH family outer membrane protein [Ruminococcus flavefaciens]MCM1555130.1 OmpH family outer membrane protein [Bacteroides sp.]
MNKKMFKTGILALSLCMIAVSCQDKQNAAGTSGAVQPVAAVEGLTIATVNIDSINMGYQLVADIQRELERTETRLTADVQNQANAFQKEYENYLKIGATLTLSEQHRREEELTKKQQSLGELQQTYANQLANLQVQRMEEVTNRILDYVKRYNEQNQNFSMIIYTGKSSNILYSQPSMDITSAILNGLNQEYAAEKAKK